MCTMVEITNFSEEPTDLIFRAEVPTPVFPFHSAAVLWSDP